MIQGIDVSRWQGEIDWSLVARSGKRFAAIRSSIGNYYTDPRFGENFTEARANGLAVGPYHVIRPDNDVASQRERFFTSLGNKIPDFVVLDVELDGGEDDPTIRHRTYWCLRFLQELDKSVLVYTADWFWTPHIAAHVMPRNPPNDDSDPLIRANGWYLWAADYFRNDCVPPPWTDNGGDPREIIIPKGWKEGDDGTGGEIGQRVHQRCSKGKVPGVSGDCDLDECTEEDFVKILGGSLEPPPPPNNHEARIQILEAQMDVVTGRVAKIDGWGKSYPSA